MPDEKKHNIVKKIEVMADLAIIVTAVLLAIVLIKNHLVPQAITSVNNSAIDNQIKSGTKLSILGLNWVENRQTLLLALSTTCHFCSESAPFYQQLLKERDGNTRIVAVLPQPVSDSKNYLNKLGVSVDDVIQIEFSSLGVRVTPTLILVDSDGVVLDWWLGKLSNIEEAKVKNRIRQKVAQK